MPQRILRVTVFLLLAVSASTLAAADPPPPEVTKLVGQLKATKAATRLKAATDLGTLKEKAAGATDVLLNVANYDPDADVRTAAWTALTAIQVATLTAKLADANDRVRRDAARDLGKLKSRARGAVENLAKVADKDPEGDVRSVAQNSLDVIKDDIKKWEAVEPFYKGSVSKKPAERVEALNQMAKLGEKAQWATPNIVAMMMDNTPAIREAAASCLEKVDPKLHKHVVTILYDDSYTKKVAAEEALEKLGERAEGAVPALKYRWSAIVADHVATLRSPDFAALTALVSAAPGDAEVASEVFRLVAIPNNRFAAWEHRVCGFLLIDKLDAPVAKKVAALTAALAADNQSQLIAIEKLVRYGADAKPALPALMKLKLGGDAEVRKAAGKAVETISAAK